MTEKICPHCSKRLPNQVHACWHCGQAFPARFVSISEEPVLTLKSLKRRLVAEEDKKVRKAA